MTLTYNDLQCNLKLHKKLDGRLYLRERKPFLYSVVKKKQPRRLPRVAVATAHAAGAGASYDKHADTVHGTHAVPIGTS